MDYKVIINHFGEIHEFNVRADSSEAARRKAVAGLERKLGRQPGTLQKQYDGSKLNIEVKKITNDRLWSGIKFKDSELVKTTLKKLRTLVTDNEFREEDHPRAKTGPEAGQFVKKGTSSSSSGEKSSGKEKESEKEGQENKKEIKITKRTQGFVKAVRNKENKLMLENGEPLPEHLAHLAIPPSWSNVIVNPNPDGDLLVLGVDKKGKVQAIYSKAHNEKALQAQEKMVKRISKDYNKIMNQVDKDLSDKAKSENALLLKLVANTGARIGSQKDKILGEVKAYGASTIEARHIIKNDDGVFLDFIGKKGKRNIYKVTDNQVASLLLKRKTSLKPEDKIFNVDYDGFLKYVKGLGSGGYTPHDFRTRLATELAKEQIKKSDAPANIKEYKKKMKAIATHVGEALNDTPSQALKSYIMPSVWSEWKNKIAT